MDPFLLVVIDVAARCEAGHERHVNYSAAWAPNLPGCPTAASRQVAWELARGAGVLRDADGYGGSVVFGAPDTFANGAEEESALGSRPLK